MPSTVEQLSPSRVKITIEVPFAELKPSLDKAYDEVAKQVNIPGFRRGKVPPAVIDQRVGRGVVLQEAINAALPEFYGQAIAEHKVTPLAQPEIEVTKLEDRELVEFTAEVDVRPEFDLPDFSAINAEVDAVDVTDEQVTEQLDGLRQRFGSLNPVERAAATDDVVTINLAATKDGEALADATADDLQYKVGSGGMLDGLDEAVEGLAAGESKSFVSELVGGPNKGESVDVEVTVTKVAEQELPDADDDFAQMASEFDTIDELKEQLKVRLGDMARVEQANSARDVVLEKAIAELDIDVPEGIRENELTARRQQITQQLAQAGMTLEQYLADTDEAEDEDAFWADVDKRSSDAIKAQMVLDSYADENEIGVDQNDLTQHILQVAQQSQQNPDEVAKHMVEHDHVAEYMTEIRRSKALVAIVTAATVTDSNGDIVDLARPADTEDDADTEDGQEADEVSGTVTDADGEPVEVEAVEVE
ncbi:MAG: trigger factor, partial [Propionibacteriales bacterium]|nr:trigger factor [Propionibacteriales bacterium]